MSRGKIVVNLGCLTLTSFIGEFVYPVGEEDML